MAILSKEDVMARVQGLVGKDTSDETLAIIEDFNDTLNDYEAKISESGEDWKTKYEENDAQWREKYKETFFSEERQKVVDDNVVDLEQEDKGLSFEDLFTEREV